MQFVSAVGAALRKTASITLILRAAGRVLAPGFAGVCLTLAHADQWGPWEHHCPGRRRGDRRQSCGAFSVHSPRRLDLKAQGIGGRQQEGAVRTSPEGD